MNNHSIGCLYDSVVVNRSRCRRSSVERKGDDGLREIEVDRLKGRGSLIANIKVSLDYPGVLRPSGLNKSITLSTARFIASAMGSIPNVTEGKSI